MRYLPLTAYLLLVACGDNRAAAPPVLGDVSVTTAEDTRVSVVVPLAAADTSAVTLSVVTAPRHGTLEGSGPTWLYTPAANYNGSDTFVARGEDSHGSAMATVTIAVTPVNDAPVANADSFMTAFDSPLTIAKTTLLANDTDVDNATLTVVAVSGSDGHGAVTTSGDNIVFTPDVGFVGNAKFNYTISDGALTAEGAVTVTIGGNIAPVAVDDVATTDEDTMVAIADAALLANDSDAEHHTLAISAVGNATNGSVSHSGTQVIFTPDANFNGAGSFEYTITDGMLTASATVTITINAVDDPPVAVADVLTVSEGSSENPFDVLANDTDIDGGPKTVVSVTQPAHGTALVVPGGISVAYTSAAGYCNEVPNAVNDTFTYTLNGGSSATVAVKVTCACGLKKSTDFVVGSNP
jgi:hypothetical protein